MLTRLDSLLFFLDEYFSLEWLQIHFEFTCSIIDIDNFFFVKPIDKFFSSLPGTFFSVYPSLLLGEK